MSHSGNSSSRRLKALKSLKNSNNDGEQLYNPSIFRYKCIGYLQLNSDHKGSPGICHGYQSKMERVANMVPDTRDGSIKKFLDAASDMGTYVDSADDDDDTSDQKVKEIYTSRTMIYKDDKLNNTNTRRIQPAKPKSSFPEDELIHKTEWSCWGSTSVHYLVLDPIIRKQQSANQKKNLLDTSSSSLPPEFAELQQQADEMFESLNDNDDPSNHKKNKNQNGRQVVTKVGSTSHSVASPDGNVCAITPENIGISIRKIDSAVGHFTVTDIGSIRICVETTSSLIGSSSNNNNTNNSNNENKQLNSNNATNGNKNRNSSNNQNNNGASDEQQPQEQKTSALAKSLDPKKFYNFTLKVGRQMEQNVMEIKEAVSEDFPGRTYRFGTKVVHRFQKTTDQTFVYMGKILDSWWRGL